METPSAGWNLLFTVRDTVSVQGRGLLLYGITAEQYGSVKSGDQLRLKHPDGSFVSVEITGVEYPPSVIWVGERPANPRYGIMVGLDAVPLGTEVWTRSG